MQISQVIPVSVTLEGILMDVHDLEKGHAMIRKEVEGRKSTELQQSLLDFLGVVDVRMKKLLRDAKIAQVGST